MEKKKFVRSMRNMSIILLFSTNILAPISSVQAETENSVITSEKGAGKVIDSETTTETGEVLEAGKIESYDLKEETKDSSEPINESESKNSSEATNEKEATESSEPMVDNESTESSETEKEKITPRGFIGDADRSITSLMLKVLGHNFGRKTEWTYTPSSSGSTGFEGGELTGFIKVPAEGNVNNNSLLPINGIEHIDNFRKGNYGARVNLVFPKGVDARGMYNTVNWEKSNAACSGDFLLTAIGIPTPIPLQWGLNWDRETVRFNASKPNEFSIMLRGIKMDQVSSAEWNKWNPVVTETALTTVGAIPGGGLLGNMNGTAEGKMIFDVSKYSGNLDDITKDKSLTKGKLVPSETRKLDMTVNVLDQDALIAGTEGAGDIGKALVKPGHEYDNPQKHDQVKTWDSYLSIWDNEGTYNTNIKEENEIKGVGTALPGISPLNRDLVVKKGDDFNRFDDARFNRVINYFTKEDVTKGNVGQVDSVDISHFPTKVPDNKKTAVTYSGTIRYINGDTRDLIPNVLNVTNNSETITDPETKGSIKPDIYTIGNGNITGSYEGDVARIRLFINGVGVATGGTLSGNKFTFYAGNQKISKSDRVTMNAYDMKDNLLQENVTVQLAEPAVPTSGTITPNSFALSNNTITGRFTGDVSKARVFINGIGQAWGGSFNSGNFSYYIGSNKIKSGDRVTINAYDKDGKLLDADKVVSITDDQKPSSGSISPSAYTVGDSMITGAYTGDVTRARVFINGIGQAWGGSFNSGSFSYYIGNNKIKAGDKVTISAYDKEGKLLDADKTVKVTDDQKPVSGTVSPDAYTVGDSTITGTYTGDATKAVVYINGKMQAWGGSFNSGNFSYYIGGNKIKTGDSVKISIYDKNDNLLQSNVEVTVKGTGQTQGTITPDVYTLGNSNITGHFTGDVTKAVVHVNGVQQAWGGTFNSNGTFSYYIGSKKITSGSTVTISAYDSNGKLLQDKVTVNVK